MSTRSVSKSSTLKSPTFDDEMDVKIGTTCTPEETWKAVMSGVKKAPFNQKNLKANGSFAIEIANRFCGIEDESCDINLDEISNESKAKPENDILRINRTKFKIKTKKITKKIKQKFGSNSLSKTKMSPPVSPCLPKAKRCAM